MQKEISIFNELVKNMLAAEETHPVAEHIPTDELLDKLDLSLSDDPINENQFTEALQELLLATPKTATNAFFNQLFGGRNPKAILGDLLAVMLNNSMYTYKAAGPQIGVEKIILNEVCRLIGWGDQSSGAFASGGSMTNFMSLLMARDRVNEQSRLIGVHQNMTVYTSEDSHYSIPKNAGFAGIGRNNVRFIPTNEKGEMSAAHLAKSVQEDVDAGFQPMMVNATAGTTVLGAFDGLKEISKVCKQFDMWLHVDGAYCGSVLFSQKYKHLIDGVELADSFSFNAHKMIGTPLTCSLILVKDRKHLYDSFSIDANYLYQTDQDDFNPGKTSLQCGRRNDALKFWTLWKSVGTKGLENIVDVQFELADVARAYVRSNPDYTLYSFDESISVCFNYKGISARELCTMLYEHAELMVGYGTFNEDEFIRLVTINAQNTKEDILLFFKTLEDFVNQHYDKLVTKKEVKSL